MTRPARSNSALSTSLLFALFTTSIAWGQATAVSQISGVVQDATGAAVPGAQLRVSQTETSMTRTSTASTDGSYTIPNLPVGPYRLEVSAAGFSTYVQTGIVLQVNSNPVINPVLQIGAVTETVSVTADAAMAETHTNAISQVIDQTRIVELPLNGRNPTQLILLSGAAAAPPTGGDLNTSKNYQTQSSIISIAGGQISGTNFLMDGGDNNSAFTNLNLPFPFPDALQEFSVQTSAIPARYGLHPGGVVNLVTKSGSNQFHGDLFEFLRNGVFNARNFFAPRRDTLKRNQFGGTIGGPVLHDKLFFFTGYQGTRNRSDPATTISFVPNQAMLNGDFTTFLSRTCTSNPVTLKAPFVNNQISPALFNPQALALAKYLPVSSDPCGRVQYGIPNNGDEDQVIGRVDYYLTEKHSIFGRYFYSDFHNDPVFNGTNALTTTKPGVADRSQSLTLGDNYSFGPNLISSFHATGTRLAVTRGSAPNLFSPADVGINISDLVSHFITLNVNNSFNLGCGTCAPGYFNTNSWQVAEDVDYIRGSHQIAFGVNWIHDQLNDVSNNLSNGTFTFNGSLTGNTLADFLIGRPNDFMQSNPQ
ncbi:MAG: carboxypeptidase-like regulatory domain-containing protein, partial [Acidobacteriota bacterium]|nr:carboxypeptidase-like regulatory domain-containing protein [Acidobacteriota bacterium]